MIKFHIHIKRAVHVRGCFLLFLLNYIKMALVFKKLFKLMDLIHLYI